jgi:phospholipid/cholesterol/gamma-HCH transport system substrate-binding protein
VKQVTKSLSQVLGGEPGQQSLQQIVDNLVKLSGSVEQTAARSGAELDVILRNVKSITGTLQEMTTGEERTLHEIVQNIQMITRDTRQVMSAARAFVGEVGVGVRAEVASLKQTLARLDNSLRNVEEVTEKVKNGEGTLGKLVSDERLGQRLGETVEDVADFTQRITQLQAEVSVRSDYLVNQAQAKTFFGLKLIPKPDRYYLIELIDDPRGSISTQIVQNNPPAAGQPVSQVQRTVSESLKFSAQFAKRFYFTTLRFGVIESTGGLGADFHFLKDHISLRMDAFNFADEQLRYPRLRAALRLQAFDHLFVTAGIDDALNPRVRDLVSNRLLSGRDFFFGGGLYFTDDDLKSIITVAGVPSP